MARLCLLAGLCVSFALGALTVGGGPSLGSNPGETIGLAGR